MLNIGPSYFAGLLLLAFLGWIQRANPLLFHTLAELVGLIVAGAVCMLVWNARRFIHRPAFRLLGSAFAVVATFDLLHLLADPGLALLGGDAAVLTTQFWLAARLVQALAFLGVVILWDRSFDIRLANAGMGVVSLGLLLAIAVGQNFPTSFLAASGQSRFNTGGGIVVTVLFLATLVFLFFRRGAMDRALHTPLVLGVLFSISAEVAILFSVDWQDTAGVLAHFFKLAAFYLFYRAIIVTGLQQPFGALFAGLTQRDVELNEANRLQSVLNALPVSVLLTDAQGKIIEKNPLSDTLWGPDVAKAGITHSSQRTYQAIVPVTGETDWPEQGFIQRALQGETTTGELLDVQYEDGRKSTLVAGSAPIYDQQGNLLGAVAIAQDITAQRQLEFEVRKNARAMHRLFVESDAVFNALTDAVVVYDQAGAILRANPQTIALYGFDPLRMSREAVVRRLEIRTPEGEPISADRLPSSRAMQGEVLVNESFTVTNPRGRTYSVLASASPVYIGREITGVVAVWRDVTERERLLREIQTQKNLLQVLFDTDPGGLAVVSGGGLIYRLVNKAYRDMTLRPEIDPIGRSVGEIMPPEEGFLEASLIREVIETGRPLWAKRYERVDPDGSLRHFLVQIQRSVWRDEPAALVVLWDTTSIEQARHALERAAREAQAYAAQLERSNRELESFASVASHDLQEPLRKIKLFGERILDRADHSLDETQLDFLHRMINASLRMESMINDLLAYSRVTSKAQPFVRVDLKQVAQEVTSDLEALLDRTHGRVEIGELPTVDADPPQMRQLLQNLIGNALKFHRPGVAPVVRLDRAESPAQPENAHTIAFSVADNGIGFDLQYLERIFRPFERLHGRGEFEGTGMGLAICAKIVERHGGKIHASSVVGEGTRFTIELPCRDE